MRISQMFFKTYKEDPVDEEIYGQKLLVRAGFIKKQGNGLYTILPMGLKTLQKIRDIIKEEMDKTGAMELETPILVPEEVYSARILHFGKEIFKSIDRSGKTLCLAPTSEEAFTLLVKDVVTSYKQLPITLYQIQKKFRDERRPRYGLQRSREFCMKDAYSFDCDIEGLDKSFNIMKQAYIDIFTRLNLDFVPVQADNGSMGGVGSTEFMVKSNIGEADIVVCDKCDYAANTEKAEVIASIVQSSETKKKIETVKTPDVKTIEELVKFLGKKETDFVKVVAYSYDNGIALALVRGDREVEETKLANLLKTAVLEMANAEQIENIGSVPGFIGATKDLKNVIVIADNEIKGMVNFVIGANKKDYHYVNANLEDLKVDRYIDLRQVIEGDLCPVCGAPLKIFKGIEVGHIFKLGTTYTERLNCKYLDNNGKEQLMQMGCYGIGLARTMSAIVEQFCDEKGIKWPKEVAPFKANIIIANVKDEVQTKLAQDLYERLNKGQILLDDRKDTFGVKLRDSELIGIPYAIISGKNALENKFEVVNRLTGESNLMAINEVVELVK